MKAIQFTVDHTTKTHKPRKEKYKVYLGNTSWKYFTSYEDARSFARMASIEFTYCFHECGFIWMDALTIYRSKWMIADLNSKIISHTWALAADRLFEEQRQELDRIIRIQPAHPPAPRLLHWTREQIELTSSIQQKSIERNDVSGNYRCRSLIERCKMVQRIILELQALPPDERRL